MFIMFFKYLVLILVTVSVQARVTIKDEDISNTLEIDSNILNIKIILENKATDDELVTTTKKTCLDVDNNLDSDTDRQPCVNVDKVDNGTALLLSPFIEEGRLEEARNASKVDPTNFLGVKSYSGFLTVDKEQKSHLFFWYFPALKPSNDTPWMIWLQGGPGASSMVGLFDEIGPFRVDFNGTLKRNPYTWLVNHALVFIDSPVGTGFSFTESEQGYVKDMATYGKHLYSVTKQLVQIFPELRVAPLYVAGESYAGKYVPALGIEIHRHKNTPGGDINLQGLMIGNAYVEPDMISQVFSPFYHFGLLEKEDIELMQPLIDGFQSDMANNRSVAAKNKWGNLVIVLLQLSHMNHAYNFLRDEMNIGRFSGFLGKSEIKRALHIGDVSYSFINVTVNTEMAPDFASSARSIFEELLDHYRVLAYCGHLDQMLPCSVSSEVIRKWKWSGSKDFLDSTRQSYDLDGRLAGYLKSGGGLTWAVIRGAGHMVPIDQPVAIQRLVSRWTHSEPLPTGSTSNIDYLRLIIAQSVNKTVNGNKDDSDNETDQNKTIVYL